MRKKLPPAGNPPPLDDDLGLTFAVPPGADDQTGEHEGTPNASAAQVQAWARAFRESLLAFKEIHDDAEATQGRLAHTLGTYAREMKGRGAWKVVNAADWETFCLEYLGLSERHVRRLAYFAQVVTAEHATFGIRKCIAGVALARRLKVRGLSELVIAPHAEEPPAWAHALGEPVRFRESSARRLEALVQGPKKLPPKPAAPSRKAVEAAERRRAITERVAGRHAAIEKLEVRSFVRDGEVRTDHRPASSKEELAALAALYAALLRDA